jgi:hypothetical protein
MADRRPLVFCASVTLYTQLYVISSRLLMGQVSISQPSPLDLVEREPPFRAIVGRARSRARPSCTLSRHRIGDRRGTRGSLRANGKTLW